MYWCRQRRDFPDISRGLVLLQTQSNVKKCVHNASIDRVEVIAKSFISMANVMLEILKENTHLLREAEEAKGADDMITSSNRLKITDEMHNCIQQLQLGFGASGYISAMVLNEANDSLRRPVVELSGYKVYSSSGCVIKNPAINCPFPWVFTHDESNSDDSLYLEVTLPKAEELSSITIQGGNVPRSLPILGPQPGCLATVSLLPCGLGIEDCDGSIENTVKSLGDVISWEKITKKNSPETVGMHLNYCVICVVCSMYLFLMSVSPVCCFIYNCCIYHASF